MKTIKRRIHFLLMPILVVLFSVPAYAHIGPVSHSSQHTLADMSLAHTLMHVALPIAIFIVGAVLLAKRLGSHQSQ